MSEQKINNSVFADFVTNSLPTEKMHNVCKSLREIGEYNSAVESSIVNYKVNYKLAEEIIGVDTEIEQSQRLIESHDRNACTSYSNVTKNRKLTIKIKEIMNNQFSKGDLVKINSLVESFNGANNPELSLEDNLANFYLNQFPGVFPEDAHEIVNGIKSGVMSFNDTLNEALSRNGIDYVEKLKRLGDGKTNEEKYEIYINFLSTLNVLETANFNLENADVKQTFEEIKSQIYTVKESVTDEELNEIIEKVSDALNNTTLTLSSSEMINQLIEHLPEGESAISTIIRGSEQDIKLKMLTSLATFIAHQKGELESTAGLELSAEQIAINVCAGIEETRVIEGVKKGIFTVENAIKVLKIIGGVALYILLGIAFGKIAAFIGTFIGMSLVALFGTSTFVVTAALIVAAICTLSFVITSVRDYMPGIVNWVEDKFDNGIKAWREKTWPYIQEKAKEFSDWINGLINGGKVSEVRPDSEPTVVVNPVQA